VRRLTLPEHASRAYSALERQIAQAFAATGAVRAAADLSGRTVLTASSSVGVIRADDVELRITPKISIHRLLWLLGYAQNPAGWRDQDDVALADVDDLVTVLAISFLAATRRALAEGVLQGYRTVEEALPVLRGRFREADQLRHRLGLVTPLEVRYDDYTVDIPENQILLTAALRLVRVPGLPATAQIGLRHILTTLADVTPLTPGDGPPATADTRLTRRYQPALRLARLVLAGRSIDQPPGPTRASGFLFDLNKVFEDWLTTTLRRSLSHAGGRLRSQYPGYLCDGQQAPIRPDLVWQLKGQPVAVLDAKYKRTTPHSQPHGDLYQMLAYCTALNLRAGHLVYASGDQSHTYVVRHTGTRIHTWVLDLTQPTTDVLGQVTQLAQHLMTDLPSET
jgi:5-methylcytosine-specific restriction enzyme subunit McrC